MAEKEKKSTRRRLPAGENISRQQDQALSGAQDAPKIGKIAGPKKTGTKTRTKTENRSKGESRTKAETRSKGAKGEHKKTSGKSEEAGAKKKAESTRKGAARGGRKPQKPALSQTAAQVQALQAQQAALEKKASRKGRGRPRKSQKPAIKVYFLGGLNEIGKNFTLYECQNDMIIVDCGLSFPDEDMPGVDSVIPDFAFVEKNRDKIRGVVITHGHEDHIGAVPYLLKKLNVPVYGTALTIGLIEGKLKEHNLNNTAKLHVTPAGSHIQMGCMDVELVHVNHSIADAVALAIHSPAGVIVHTGDFKIDMTPAEGSMIDLARFAELGKEGVLALLADSTNAERPGYTQTEQTVNNSLDSLFMRAEGKRIIVATFASSISRVQMIINCAVKYGRKVALSGRSMVNVMGIASELGYLHVPDGVLVGSNLSTVTEPGQLVLSPPAARENPCAALARMAFADHRKVAMDPNDFIIISARPIPGNEKTVGAW